MVERIFSEGYDTVFLIKDAGIEGLCEIKGIGPGIASSILDSLEDVEEEELPRAEPEIEEATGLAMVEEEEEAPVEEPSKTEEGFITRIFKKISSLFSGGKEKEEEKEEEGEKKEGPPSEKEDEEKETGETEEGPEEPEKGEETTTEPDK
jgi:hypothetical protein